MQLTIKEVVGLGITERSVQRKIASGEWKSVETGRIGRNGKAIREVLLTSLPDEMQTRWLQGQRIDVTPDEFLPVIEEPDTLDAFTRALKRLPLGCREAWMAECQRLASIVERYNAINPKRARCPRSQKHEFVPAVLALCVEAACDVPEVLGVEPRRAMSPSPFTLDGWARKFVKEGLTTFLRSAGEKGSGQDARAPRPRDGRRAKIDAKAGEWINESWRNFRSPRAMYTELKKRAAKNSWKNIPSEAWLYRKWAAMPLIVKVSHMLGEKAYTSQCAPYYPRDYSDLEALQILCGDHSVRDVTVLLKDGTLARPWLTLWQCLRTGLLWGWSLNLVPSSFTIGLAYADGVKNFGAQPLSRPDEDFWSYIYTDQGRDYKGTSVGGKTLVFKNAARIEGGMEVLRTQRRVGLADDMGVKQLLARGYNAREKPVERVHRDISKWEENTFDEWCGSDAKNKPDQWREMWAQHDRFARGKRSDSPFMDFGSYRDNLAGWINEYNHSVHTRVTLGGAKIVPIEEHNRLYTTRYDIGDEALALLLMHAARKKIGKNGVQMFQRHWSFLHPAMSEFKGREVEVRYADDDYSRVWVILPNGQICESQLVTPGAILNPNKQTLGMVAQQQAHEKKVKRDFMFLTHSEIRGESVEDRVAEMIQPEEVEMVEAVAAQGGASGNVRVMTRMDGKKLRAVPPLSVTAGQISSVETDHSIFDVRERARVSEFDFDD